MPSPAKTTDNDQKLQQEPLSDTDKTPDNKNDKTDNDSSQHIDIPIRQTCDAVGDVVADLLMAEEERKANEAHAREQAEKYTGKRPKSYSELARSVPSDTSSPEAEKICRAAHGLLMKGMAPRIDFLVSDTGLPETTIQAYMDNAPWVRKDDSSPAGIVVYLPSEAPA